MEDVFLFVLSAGEDEVFFSVNQRQSDRRAREKSQELIVVEDLDGQTVGFGSQQHQGLGVGGHIGSGSGGVFGGYCG